VTTYYKKEIMAININKVYKSVLSILNKEQRGYLTPSEYNNLARQAQLELLDKLFYDYNKFLNIEKAGRVNDALADIPVKIQEQIDPFYAQADITLTNGVGTLPTDVYKTIDLTITNETIEVEKIDKNRLPYLKSSPLTKPTTSFPVYYQRAADIIVEPAFTDQSWTLGDLRIKYIKVPVDPRWGYTTNSTYGTQTYDSDEFVSGGGILGAKTIGIVSDNPTNLSDGALTIDLQNSTTGVTSTSSGTGMNITITASSNTVTSVTVNSAGSGYTVGDSFTLDSSAGSIVNADDIEITLRTEDLYTNTTQGSTDFVLHPSQETELIISILAYTGFIIKDPNVVQQAVSLNQGAQMAKQQQ